MKKYIKEISLITLAFVLIPLIFSIINLFEIEIGAIFYLISIIAITFISGIIIGKNAKTHAYKKGLILGAIFVLVMLFLSVILGTTFSFNMITYYLIVLISTTLGSMLGIQKR